jgi:hypothetical protein
MRSRWPPLLTLENVSEGARKSYNLAVNKQILCLNAQASQHNLKPEVESRCLSFKGTDYESCVADVVAAAGYQYVLTSPAPQGCASNLGEDLTSTTAEIAKSICSLLDKGAAILGTSVHGNTTCGPPPSAADAPPFTPYQYCLMGAIEYRPNFPTDPDLIKESNAKCSVKAGVTTVPGWEQCMHDLLYDPTTAVQFAAESKITQNPTADANLKAAISHKHNFYSATESNAALCEKIRATQK